MKPLLVTAHLGSPVAGDPSLPLDGILLSAAYERRYGHALALAQPGVPAVEVDYSLSPLMQVSCELGPFYACSFARWPEHSADGSITWNRRADVELFAELTDAAHLETGKGPYKSYHVLLPYRSAHYVQWCCIGDRDAIADLLMQVVHIGKKQAQGFGHVLAWNIERAETNWSLFDADGRPARALPLCYILERFGSWPVEWTLARRAFRPPYWDIRNVIDVFMPPAAASLTRR